MDAAKIREVAKRPNLGTVMGENGSRGKAWRDVNKQKTGVVNVELWSDCSSK